MPNLNALRHGCCAEEIIILPHEKREDFEALTKQYQNTYENLGEFEQNLLHHAILSEWLHIRATKEYLETVAYLYKTTPIQVEWTDEQHQKLK